MMRGDVGLVLLLLRLLLSAAAHSNNTSPPGKPVLLGCRSPEKETFTCWWEPGSDGGLPTTQQLLYEREGLEGTHECPDYLSAGHNSCFFDRAHTSIWVDYQLTVVASNALGNATSEPLRMDVMEIVKPDAPGNVSVQLETRQDDVFVQVDWDAPANTDPRSGWVTIKYQVRVKQDHSHQWKEYTSGTQTQFDLYNISPGSTYTVQVRCRLDHGSWSEWSNSASVKTNNYPRNEKSFWIVVSTFSSVVFLTVMCLLVMKRKNVKLCLLPPVPGPKIRGIDVQLLKSGQPEGGNNVLIITQTFPSAPAWRNESEDYMIVYDDVHVSDSQKRKKSLTGPNGFLFNLDKSSISGHSDREKTAEARTNERSVCENETLQKHRHEAAEQKKVQLVDNCGYVDDQRQMQEVKEETCQKTLMNLHEDLSCVDVPRQGRLEDYSRVKEVDGDNNVLLQRQNLSADRRTDSTNKKPKNPHGGGACEVEACTDTAGYVDTVPSPLTFM